jgi:hypothetical protein
MAQAGRNSQPSRGKRNCHRLSIAFRRLALLSWRSGVIHVVTAAITAEGEKDEY